MRFRHWLYGLAVVGYRLTDERAIIDADIDRWYEVGDEERWDWPSGDYRAGGRVRMLLALFRHDSTRAFRDLFYYRLKRGNQAGALTAKVLSRIYTGEPALHLACPEIGPGLYLAHGFSSFLSADRIGSRCRIHQNVTFGLGNDSRRPTIGDDVTIYAGAVVFGGITVGDGAVVGANAVVNRDVPPGQVAVGVPAIPRPPGPDRARAGLG